MEFLGINGINESNDKPDDKKRKIHREQHERSKSTDSQKGELQLKMKSKIASYA